MANVQFKVKDVITKLGDVNGSQLWKGACNTLAGLCGEDWVLELWVPDLPSTTPGTTPGTTPSNPVPVPAAPPVDVVKVFDQIAQAVNKASSVLDQQHLMVASGSVTVDVNVKIPGTDIGAESHLALQIGPKPYN